MIITIVLNDNDGDEDDDDGDDCLSQYYGRTYVA